MGLFDGYIDPQQFSSGGGLLGRLLSLQKFPDQYQDDAGQDQPPASPTMSPAAMLSPLLSGLTLAYRQSTPADAGVSGAAPSSIAGMQASPASIGNFGNAANPSAPAVSPPAPNTQLAQSSSARPNGMFVPPNVFIPGTPENDAFVHSTINGYRAIGNAVGNILNNENANRPPAGSRGINKTPWSGDHTQIKKAVGAEPNDDVRISPTGDVWAQKPDGSWENHGPADSYTGSGKPSGQRGKDRDR